MSGTAGKTRKGKTDVRKTDRHTGCPRGLRLTKLGEGDDKDLVGGKKKKSIN